MSADPELRPPSKPANFSFADRDTMDIRSEPGTKLIYCFPENGRPEDKKRADVYLQVDKTYTLAAIEVHGSITKVWLEETPDSVWFNSVQFSVVDEEIVAPVDSLHGVISTPLPCPFCGGEAKIEVRRVILTDRTRIYCHCETASVHAYSREEAVARWNRRAPRCTCSTCLQHDAVERKV